MLKILIIYIKIEKESIMFLADSVFELDILDKIEDFFEHDVMDTIMKFITHLGDGGLIWIIITLCLLISKQYRKLGILCAIGLILGLIIGNGIVKNLVSRERPFELADSIDRVFPIKIDKPTDRSFPSGHTQASFIVATILMMAKRKFGIPALILAFLIGFSRLYLKVHFPTDVLGGMLMGIAIGLTVWFVYKWKFEKKFGPVIEPKIKPEKEK